MFTVYVIYSDKSLTKYTGQTEDLDLRLQQHNEGTLGRYTKNKGPWRLLYKEEFETRGEAMIYEKYLKSGIGREFIKSKFGV